jgi:hypothetical protein
MVRVFDVTDGIAHGDRSKTKLDLIRRPSIRWVQAMGLVFDAVRNYVPHSNWVCSQERATSSVSLEMPRLRQCIGLLEAIITIDR